jgi:lysyl-tRNA synthetase, class I
MTGSARALGGTPPEGFNYELFLDEQGQKISKSKGNGLTIDEWLTYAPPESLALFMFQKPARGQEAALRRDPARVDDYQQFLGGYAAAGLEEPARQPGLAYPCRRAA